MNLKLLILAFVFASSVSRLCAAGEIKGFAPVSISSANYRETSWAELKKAVNSSNVVNPPAVPTNPRSEPVLYIFLAGEIFESDVSFSEICAMLSKSLAKKNYQNASDEVGIIREPGKVRLVLRVSYGVRPWRDPRVRTESLTWREGLEARPRGRGLQALGGEVAFDSRGGGNDDALSAAGSNASNPNSYWGSGGGGAAPIAAGGAPSTASISSPGAGSVVGYEATRDFNIVVVDAFDYAELKEKGKGAKRVWTTFVAAPKEPKQHFSDIAATMMNAAASQWGETTRGLQVLTDARADVQIGEAVEIPEEKKQ